MIGIGDRVSEATVWTAPHVRKPLSELLGDGRALILFYLFDWSAT